jgi:hypothetical protein
MYEDLYKKAEENNLDFVKADFYRFVHDEKDNLICQYNHLSKKPEDYNVVFNPSEDPEAIRYIMNTWSGIYKKSFIEEYHIRHNETPGASFQDNGFWFQTFIYAKRAMIIDTPYYMNRRDNPNSSVHNREKVYCVNVEYDHIRDILMKSPELWERFKHMYWFKKYNNYMGTIKRIGDEYKREYVKRFSAEFKRGMDQGELSADVFTARAWENIQLLVKDPDVFCYTKVFASAREQALMKENKKLKKKITKMRKSKTFKIGKAVMYIPGKLKKLFSGK